MANELARQVSNAVHRMPPSRRALLAGGLVGVAAAVIGVGLWASEPSWVTLYDDVSLGEAGQMIDALEQDGVRSKLGRGGSQVLVAKGEYARARVVLAKSDLPESGRPGFKLLDQQNIWGTTDFIQRVTYQRALEGELARSIGATTGVDRADVHLTIPEPTALRRTDRPAKAAVRLRIRAGSALAPGAVQGIIATVSNSVDRLSPENVVVTDETGRLLSGPTDDATVAGGAGRRMEVQQSLENYLAGKAQRLLESVAGLGAPRVQVGADLNFDQVERTIESFDPDGQVLAAEGRSETDAAPDGAGAQTVINNTYQNSRRLEKILNAGGGITRLTVSVLVDERALRSDTVTAAPVPDRLANVEALVRNAVGFDSARGDRITVRAVPFEVVALDTSRVAPSPDLVGVAERFARPAIGLVAIIALMIVGLKVVKALQSGRGAAARGQLPPYDADGVVPPLGPPPEAVLLKNRVVEESSTKPELMAQVVRAWMGEGGGNG
jgi:flagellar M-ring protein FliF